MAASTKEYKVRMLRDSSTKFYMMRFKQKVDLEKLDNPTMERSGLDAEDEELPTHGEGSEYGRKRREVARLRRRGYDLARADPSDQPWQLKEHKKKNGRSFIGRKEGGVNQSASYYMLRLCSNDRDTFEAIPISNWYNFSPSINYNTFTAEEAEEQYQLKHKTLNYFSLMLNKKLQSKEDDEEETVKGLSKRFIVSEGGAGSMSDDSNEGIEKDDISMKVKNKKKLKAKKSLKSTESAESSGNTTEEGEMESHEVDYISNDSSSSEDNDNFEKQMEDAKRKTKGENFNESSEGESENEEELTEEGKQLDALIKKQNIEEEEEQNEGSEEEEIGEDMEETEQSKLATEADSLKRKREVEPLNDEPTPKRSNLESNPHIITEGEVRYYVERKPITTKQLQRKFIKVKTRMEKQTILAELSRIINILNVQKSKRDGKTYLFLPSQS